MAEEKKPLPKKPAPDPYKKPQARQKRAGDSKSRGGRTDRTSRKR